MSRKIAWMIVVAVVGLVLLSSIIGKDKETVMAQTEIEPEVDVSVAEEPIPIEDEIEMLYFHSLWGLDCREYEYPAEVTGLASWYGGGEVLNAHTANGEFFDPMAMTAAHLYLTFGSLVEVTNLEEPEREPVMVRVNDRGPNPRFTDRIIDLTRGAMFALGGEKALRQGLVRVKIRVVELGPECELCKEER